MNNRIKTCNYSETERGVLFKCPGCGEMHVVPLQGSPSWQWNGSLDKPTLSPSLLVRTGHYVPGAKTDECWCSYNANHPDDPAPFVCGVCHSFVREGRIEFLSDCTHELAGKTVDLAEVHE